MLRLLIKFTSYVLARSPEAFPRVCAACLGEAVYWGLASRRRLLLANLHHAFPERSSRWRRQAARLSCRRTMETALLSLASAHFQRERVQQILELAPSARQYLAEVSAQPRPVLLCTPHLGHWEALTYLPAVYDGHFPPTGVIYRPLDNPVADAWVKQTRERFGMQLLSRRDGFQQAMKMLRRNEAVGLLFDQNAGESGALMTFLGRLASVSELPGLLADRFGADVVGCYPKRIGFWRSEFEIRLLAQAPSATEATLRLNAWLEELLRSDEETCLSWLWLHNRWRTQHAPERRLRIESKRNLLSEELRFRNWPELPRKLRLFIRLPNWLGDVVMALPLVRAVRRARPDAEITLLVRDTFAPLARALFPADRVVPLAKPGPKRFLFFRKLRRDYPDLLLLLTNSFRGDLEGWLSASPQRFGIDWPGQWRPFLTHAFRPPAAVLDPGQHQLEVGHAMLRHFGLAEPLDLTPCCFKPEPGAADDADHLRVGLICGSANNPAKRWPTEHWRTLIGELQRARPELVVELYGTAADATTTGRVANGLGEAVRDLAGRTDSLTLARRLAGCRLVIGNDTGGIHLANALGVPVIALYGPTNPQRTGPIFESPRRILQPEGTPPKGGHSLAALAPGSVAAAALELLTSREPAPAP